MNLVPRPVSLMYSCHMDDTASTLSPMRKLTVTADSKDIDVSFGVLDMGTISLRELDVVSSHSQIQRANPFQMQVCAAANKLWKGAMGCNFRQCRVCHDHPSAPPVTAKSSHQSIYGRWHARITYLTGRKMPLRLSYGRANSLGFGIYPV